MGLCSSSDETTRDEKARSKEFESKIAKDQKEDQQVSKLLLLGAGESGKSTLFKQMLRIYGKGFSIQERQQYITIIHNNMIQAMKTLCKMAATFGQQISTQNQNSLQVVENLKGEEEITPELGTHLAALWEDKAIQTTYDQRSRFQLADGTKYFFDMINTVCKSDYLPSEDDILRCRVRTTGIVENEFEIDGNKFRMFDVGGQRNERKKWIHCFEGVTAVLFVAAISEYDQTLYEDESVNRMTEALNLFEEICNSRWFQETSIMLFLNKRDLFYDKIEKQKVPLTVCWRDYEGESNYEDGVKFITNQFLARNHNPQSHMVYCHCTCATDKDNVQFVFNAVKDTVIRTSLAKIGLAPT